MARRFKGWPPPPRKKDSEGNKIPKQQTVIEYNIKNEQDKVEKVVPGTTFQTPSGAQFRMLKSGSLIRADRSRKMNKKERRENRKIVKARTEEVRQRVAAYEGTLCICGHKRTAHKNDEGPCVGCSCSKFVEEVHVSQPEQRIEETF